MIRPIGLTLVFFPLIDILGAILLANDVSIEGWSAFVGMGLGLLIVDSTSRIIDAINGVEWVEDDEEIETSSTTSPTDFNTIAL